MTETTETTTGPTVWEDGLWTLGTDATGEALTLSFRGEENLGQLDDEMAAQLGRIANRLVRILEGLPMVDRAEVNRSAGSRFGVRFTAVPESGLTAEDLHAVATRLANWGGEARV